MKGMPVLLCADSMKLSLKHRCRKLWSPGTGIKTGNKSISRGWSTKPRMPRKGVLRYSPGMTLLRLPPGYHSDAGTRTV